MTRRQAILWGLFTCGLIGCATTPVPPAAKTQPAADSARWAEVSEPSPSASASPPSAPTPSAPAPSEPPAPGLPIIKASPGLVFDFKHELIPFVSNRLTDSSLGGFDLFIFDATAATVWSPPGANTPGNEANPALTADNHWLVYATDFPGTSDIWLYDMDRQVVDTLPLLNTPANEVSPALDSKGDLLVYTSDIDGIFRLHVFDLRTNIDWVPAPVYQLGTRIDNPNISLDGRWIAFSTPSERGDLDIYLYNLGSGTVWLPPFINSPYDDDEPFFSPDHHHIAFSTNRRGNWDIMLADIVGGYVDPLPLANSPEIDVTPSFIGTDANRILFITNRIGPFERQMMEYYLVQHVLDTLPVAHEPGTIDTFTLQLPEP